ncbi:uncharacterized protein KY384_008939 [Bacidia gigantensis]|uniref:uncharacterized protein n=1 Tax=Bacidia gigantensis TaxID=2732470 RepID=UPI001D039489|nr:uncharacterized protein KY384_008939 [Bacidia gigantensis]KAG8525295.1 hypothetical protein KY384_008939 [Bacidia gigantensis]
MNFAVQDVEAPALSVQGSIEADTPRRERRSPLDTGESSCTPLSVPLPSRQRMRSVSIIEGKQYVPRQKPPILLAPKHGGESSTNFFDLKSRKVILHCFKTPHEAPLFTLGTHFGGTTIRDTEDVPFAKIYDYITPEELQRFENRNYAEEEEQERIRILTAKPRGRPRKNPFAPPGLDPKHKDSALRPKTSISGLKHEGYNAFRKLNADGKPRRGRPVGWRKHAGVANVSVPSFNGPQPTGRHTSSANEASDEASDAEGQSGEEDETSSEEIEDPIKIQARLGVYSMVAASGIVPTDPWSESEASRSITPALPIDDDPGYSLESERSLADSSFAQQQSSFLAAPNPLPYIHPSPKVNPTEHLRIEQPAPKRRKIEVRSGSNERASVSSTPASEKPLPGRTLPTRESFSLPSRPSTHSTEVSAEDQRLSLLEQFKATAATGNSEPMIVRSTISDSSLEPMESTVKPKQHVQPKTKPESPSPPSSPDVGMLITPENQAKRTSMTPMIPSSKSSCRSSRIYGKGQSIFIYSPKRSKKTSSQVKPKSRPPKISEPPKAKFQPPLPPVPKTQPPELSEMAKAKRPSQPATSTSTSISLDPRQSAKFKEIADHFAPRPENTLTAARLNKFIPSSKTGSPQKPNSDQAHASSSSQGPSSSSEEESDDESETSFMGVPEIPESVRKNIDPQLINAGAKRRMESESGDSEEEEAEDGDEDEDELGDDEVERDIRNMLAVTQGDMRRRQLQVRKHR